MSERNAQRRGDRAARRKAAAQRIETQFLPAALEVLETPPSPIGRAILWLILIATGATLAWAFLAHVDVVAVAEGRVIPRGRLQNVEAAEAGIVRALHVEEGQRVRAGDLLIELDPTIADADAAVAQREYATAQLARARADALLAFAETGEETPMATPDGADPVAAAAEAQAAHARIVTLRERLAGVDQRIAGASAARTAAEETRLGLAETLPLAEEQLRARQALLERGFAPRLQVLREEERVVSMRRELRARAAESRQAAAEIALLRRERSQALEEFRAQAAAEKAEAEAIVATRAQSVRAAEARAAWRSLRSPVDGLVHEIAVTTLGEVVEAGAPLLTIVPAGGALSREELVIEALVLNRDAGFVREGARAIVKLEAYPFTRHGYLEGVVEFISPDAVADEARGLVFPARIRITGSRLRDVARPRLHTRQANTRTATTDEAEMRAHSDAGRGDATRRGAVTAPSRSSGAQAARAATRFDPARLPISPGMAAQVEIITGRRSVVSYILSPIARATNEAGRER